MKTLCIAALLCLCTIPAFAEQGTTAQPAMTPVLPPVATPALPPATAPTANTAAPTADITRAPAGHTFADFRGRLLKGMDNRITELQRREQCIRGARDLVGLSACPPAADTNCTAPR